MMKVRVQKGRKIEQEAVVEDHRRYAFPVIKNILPVKQKIRVFHNRILVVETILGPWEAFKLNRGVFFQDGDVLKIWIMKAGR